jgi:hypothetical protein
MEKNSTLNKKKARITHLTWLGTLAASVVLFATCYEWALIDQPEEAAANSTITVPIVIKRYNTDLAANLANYGFFGVLVPDGWTVHDSIPYTSEGTTNDDPVGPYDSSGYVIYDAAVAQMYVDSAVVDYEARTSDNPDGWSAGDNIQNYDTPEGYYWWGGKTSGQVRVDNLDSITVTVTITTGTDPGAFNLRYAFGSDDWWPRKPVIEGGMSDLIPITITATNTEPLLGEEISVYPNPASDILSVRTGKIRKGNLELFDITGRLHASQEILSRTSRFDVSDYPSGTYILKVRTLEGEYTRKLLIK